jgi:hypothetical protein
MSLITMEVQIDHGTLTAKEPHLLPETGAGLLTIIRSGESPIAAKTPVQLPLVRRAPGTVINPTAEDLDASLWE